MNNKNIESNFHLNSYERHTNWYNKLYPNREEKTAVLESIRDYKGSINHWLQDIFFDCLTPLIKYKDSSWLTVGDAYGHDAMHLLTNGVENVIASDLNADFLAISQEFGFVNNYSPENAENLSFQDSSIDYILCKESYHHLYPYLFFLSI